MIIGGIEMNEKEHEILSGRLMKIIEKYAHDKDVREELHTYSIYGKEGDRNCIS